MKLKKEDLKTERQWRAATGLDQPRFEKLLVLFTASYLKLFGKSVAERQADIETRPSLTSEEELLLVTLFSLKSGLTYDLLGVVSGMDGSNAKRNQELGLKVLEQTPWPRQGVCRNGSSKMPPDSVNISSRGSFSNGTFLAGLLVKH